MRASAHTEKGKKMSDYKKCDACNADTDEWYAIPYNYHNEVNKYDSDLILCKECFESLLELLRERTENE